MKKESLNLDSQKIDFIKHVPSFIQADTLFTFTTKIDYVIEWLSVQRLFARYNIENIRYLKIANFARIAFPMKCFCDINLHRLKKHVGNYGKCGLAFTKEWGMKHGVQPIQYINPYSELSKDISEILNPIFNSISYNNESEELCNLKSYALHQLMFYKPYSDDKQCFTDECEWRFVPRVPDDLPPIILREQDMMDERLKLLNEIIKQNESLAIPFRVEDIKYIIVEKEDDFDKIVATINAISLNSSEQNRLLSKIIVWETSEEDF